MSRKALGKGLEAIFGNLGTEVVNPTTGKGIHEIELNRISPNPFQPRQEFGSDEIQELANSIAEKGILQPILLRKHGSGFQIVAGERRFRAMKFLEKTHIPAHVREHLSDKDMMEMALIENIQRVQLNPIEEAIAFEQLINNCGVTHEELAHKIGKSRSAITNTLRLLKLDSRVQDMIKIGKLSAGHGRALLQEDSKTQWQTAHKIVNQSLNVRETEKINTRKEISSQPISDPHVKAFQDKLRDILGTKIIIKGNQDKGILEIHYLSRPELENIARLLEQGQRTD